MKGKKRVFFCVPNDSSYRMAAFVMFMYIIIDRMTSGIISDGGITCSKYWRFWSVRSRHCRISPSWPNDADTVGSPRAEVNDFTVSEATFVIVVSNTICGGWLFFTASVYTEQTMENEKKWNKWQENWGILGINWNKFFVRS